MKKLAMVLLLFLTVCINVTAVEELSTYGLKISVPNDWIVLYQDELDQRRSLIEQPWEESKGEPSDLDAESTVFTCFDEKGTTEIQITAVENEFSRDAYQLSRVPSDYKDSFIKGLQSGQESTMFGMTYSKSRYYEHSQAQFIRYEMTWEMGNRVVPMLKYYTVVNGVSFSVNLFCWDEDLSEADETLVQQVVDSMQWDEILEPTEEFLGYTSASLGGSLTILAGVLAACGLLFAAFTYEDWKPIVQKWFKKGSTGKRK